MTTQLSPIDCEAVRNAFQQWRAEQEPLDAELSESLAALGAYQSHLDGWQQQLAGEREELRSARQQLDEARATAEQRQAQITAEAAAELSAAREKISALTDSLLSRTEELRMLDNRRAEVVTELELAAAREKELKAALEEHKQSREQERAQWAEELRTLRELLEHRVEGSESASGRAAEKQPPSTRPSQQPGHPADSPVLISIVEQFGKLRQQRAWDTVASKKAR